MSAVADAAAPVTPEAPRDRPGVPGLPSLCPFLATAEGTWRSATPVREHRCTAVAPPVPLAIEKQRRLCLVDAHLGCVTYAAAVAARSSTVHGGALSGRPVARMTPTILDAGRFDLRLPTIRADRTSGQAALVAVLAVALVAILLARPAGDAGGLAPAGSPGTSAGALATTAVVAPPSNEASASRTAAASPEAGPTSEPTARPSPAASTSARPAASEPVTSGATYRVKSGDTLSAIAARFGTTTPILVRLNDIKDPSKLKIGQILKLP